MKFTPGPWQVTPDLERVQTGKDADDYEIADCSGGSFPDVPCIEGNARLISAAPELLSAVKELTKQLDMHIDRINTHCLQADRVNPDKVLKRFYKLIERAEGKK